MSFHRGGEGAPVCSAAAEVNSALPALLPGSLETELYSYF